MVVRPALTSRVVQGGAAGERAEEVRLRLDGRRAGSFWEVQEGDDRPDAVGEGHEDAAVGHAGDRAEVVAPGHRGVDRVRIDRLHADAEHLGEGHAAHQGVEGGVSISAPLQTCDSGAMTSEVTDELRGFGVDARRVVALAETEARGHRHTRVGTEHLLIGLLAVEGSVAAERLREAGITLAAARHKVVEAVPPGDAPALAVLLRSERAARALGRSVRFSHAARASSVGTEHVLLGVLDVEGHRRPGAPWPRRRRRAAAVDAQGAGAVGRDRRAPRARRARRGRSRTGGGHAAAAQPSPARCARRCSTMPSTTGCSSPPARGPARWSPTRAGSAAGSSASARAERPTAQR